MGLNENGDVLGRGGARLAWHQRVLDRLTDSAWAIFDAVESYAARPHPRRAASMHARARAVQSRADVTPSVAAELCSDVLLR